MCGSLEMTHKLIFSCKASFGRLGGGGGVGGFPGGRFKNLVKNWFLTEQIFLIQLFFSAFKSPNGLPISKQNQQKGRWEVRKKRLDDALREKIDSLVFL